MKKVLFFSFQGDLDAFMKRKGSLKLATAVKFALDIARSIQFYVHSVCLKGFCSVKLIIYQLLE